MKQRKIVGYAIVSLIVIMGLSPIVLEIKKAQRSNALAVTKITPEEGPTVGGNSITIEGSDFLKRLTVKEVTVGGATSCLLSSEQWVYCWGSNEYGAVGNGTGGPSGANPGAKHFTIPQAIVHGEIPSGVKLKQVASGYHAVYAIGTDDQVYMWGHKHFSPIKLSSYLASGLPNGVKPVKISAGHYPVSRIEVAILGSDNQIYIAGVNNNTLRPLPSGQLSPGEKIIEVATSKNAYGATGTQDVSLCVVTDLGKAYCSHNEAPFATIPQGQIPADAKIASISIASSTDPGVVPAFPKNACVLTTDGQAYCWGTMGVDGASSHHMAPTAVKMPHDKKVKKIKTGRLHICLISEDDQGYCWSNENGHTADGTGVDGATSNIHQPNPILSGQIPVGVKIVDLDLNSGDAKRFETCAIGDNYKAYCWGGNHYGQSQLDGQPIVLYGMPVNQPTLVPFGTDDETKVMIDGVLTPTRIIDQQHLEIVAPPHAPGKVDIVVMNNAANVVTLREAYTYLGDSTTQPSQSANPGDATQGITTANNQALAPNSGYQKKDSGFKLMVAVSGGILVTIGLIMTYKKMSKRKY